MYIPQFNDSELLQHDLDNLYTWLEFIQNHLSFSISKCVFHSFNCKYVATYCTAYTIDFQHLPQLDSHHDLGVSLSTNLAWNNHLNHISSKAYILAYLSIVILLMSRNNFTSCLCNHVYAYFIVPIYGILIG